MIILSTMSLLDLAQPSANGIDLDTDTMTFRAEDATVQDNSDIQILVVVAVSANIETVSVTQDKGGQVDMGCTTIPCWLRLNGAGWTRAQQGIHAWTVVFSRC